MTVWRRISEGDSHRRQRSHPSPTPSAGANEVSQEPSCQTPAGLRPSRRASEDGRRRGSQRSGVSLAGRAWGPRPLLQTRFPLAAVQGLSPLFPQHRNHHASGLSHSLITSKSVCLGLKPVWVKTKINCKLASAVNRHAHLRSVLPRHVRCVLARTRHALPSWWGQDEGWRRDLLPEGGSRPCRAAGGASWGPGGVLLLLPREPGAGRGGRRGRHGQPVAPALPPHAA